MNPLLDAFQRTTSAGAVGDETRTALIATYGFAVPTDEALDAIVHCSPAGVVEIGAGTGYWAHLLSHRGVDVVAFDIEPPPSAQSPWFAGRQPWHPVLRGDHSAADRYPDRTLLVVWPTKNEMWAAEAVQRYHDAGGESVVYVGEPPGGRTGDDVFHAMLGELTTCIQCAYGSTTSPCICQVDTRWRRTATITLPHWPGYHDDLHVYVRSPDGRASRRQRWRRPRAHRREPT